MNNMVVNRTGRAAISHLNNYEINNNNNKNNNKNNKMIF